MQQIVLQEPGRFELSEGPEPRADKTHAMVHVHRVGVCGTDLHAFAGRQPYFQYPRILGHELGVVVEKTPDNDQGIRAGDQCAVEPYINCDRCIACRRGKPNCCENLQVLGVHIDGGMRPTLAIPVHKLHKSDKLSLEQLALVETLAIGAHAVERGAPQPDETVLVIGVGPIGLGLTQFAVASAANVVVMDMNEHRLAFCRELLGITSAINAGAQTAGEQLRHAAGGDLPTLIFDATGNAASMMTTFDLVAPGGRIVFAGLVRDDITFADPQLHAGEITLMASRNALPQTFKQIIKMIEIGQIYTSPWITHRMSLPEVPTLFPKLLGDVNMIKAMIDVP